MTQQGWILGGDDKEIWLTKEGNRLSFDIVIPTSKGVLFAMYTHCDTEIAGATADEGPVMTIQQAHDRLAHPGEEMTRKTAKELGWTITRGVLKPCNACTAGKAKQRSVPKVSTHQVATKANEARVFLDIMTVKSPKDGPKVTKPIWRVIVDEGTQLKFSDFFQRKTEW
jgi:hypothetical protein